jgi:hypothetical protein
MLLVGLFTCLITIYAIFLQMLLKDLDFNLVVFNPYRPLQAYLMDAAAPQEVAQAAWAALNDSFKCDAPLMYPPHVLALGCLVFAAAVAPLKAPLVPPPEQLQAQQQMQGVGLPDMQGAPGQHLGAPAYTSGAAMGAGRGLMEPSVTSATAPGHGSTAVGLVAATGGATDGRGVAQGQGVSSLAAPNQQQHGIAAGAGGDLGPASAWDLGEWLAGVNADLQQVGMQRVKSKEGSSTVYPQQSCEVEV